MRTRITLEYAFSQRDLKPLTVHFASFWNNKEWVIDLEEYASNPEKYPGVTLPEWLQALAKSMAGDAADSA